jgi:hypothetical protein
MDISKEKIEESKNLLKNLKQTGQKRNIYNNVFNLLKDEILELKEKGLTNNGIVLLLNDKLNADIKLSAFNSWYYRNFKKSK